MKLTKPLYGVPLGEVYPRWFAAGDDCPENLIEAAKSIEAVEVKALSGSPENKRAKK